MTEPTRDTAAREDSDIRRTVLPGGLRVVTQHRPGLRGVHLGWFVGVVFLWTSETWSTGEKLLGTLLVPGGLALPLFLLTVGTSANSCGGTPPRSPRSTG